MPAKRKENKCCPRCKVTKTRAEFYESKGSISAYCRACFRSYQQNEGHEIVLRAAKNYRESSEGKIKRRQYINSVGAKYRSKYKAEGKIQARYQAWYNLTKLPCEVCKSPDTHAHHDDYSKPLDVRWLCSQHHGQEHRKYG
jgi:hypothetical protein